MAENKLFNIDPVKKENPTLTCRTCKYRYKHTYGKMFYCSKQQDKQKRTAYGHKKIKAGDPACYMYEKEVNNG